MEIRRQVTVLASIVLVSLAPGARAAEPAATRPTIDAIAKVAKDLCARPNLYGYTRRVSGQVEGRLDVTKLLRNLLNAGVSAQAKGEGNSWSGVVQRDATAALRDSNQCASAMFSLMFNHFYVQQAGPLVARSSPPPSKKPPTGKRAGSSSLKPSPKLDPPLAPPVKASPNVESSVLPSSRQNLPTASESKPPSPPTQLANAAPTTPQPARSVRPTPEEIAVARRHRDSGDELFNRLLKARKASEINSLIPDVEAWDRKGADIAVDVFGNIARPMYEATGSHQFYPPNSISVFAGHEAVGAFFRRREKLNLIRYRQQALSTLFVTRPPN